MIGLNSGAKPSGAVTAAVAAALLLMLGVVIVLFNEHGYGEQKARELGVQAQIVSASTAPALMFLDNASAQQYLEALSANPAVSAAGVYDADGVRVASYQRSGEEAPPLRTDLQSPRQQGRTISVVTEVTRDGEHLGLVYLRTDAETAVQRFARYAGLGILVLMASLLFFVFGRAQGALRRANAELETRAEQLQQEIHQREKAEEDLLQSRKMEAIGQLVGGVAHDFNNLLTVVLSGLRLMDRNPDPQRRAITAEAMRQAVERGAGLTRQLLAFARRQTLQPEVMDIGARLISMRELLERSIRADILVEIQVADALWAVKSDPTQLELAILNLAVNARDAMPKGGVLTIEAKNASTADGDFVTIIVRDTGVGMTDDVRKRVFEPYFTTKQAGQGTGLGLAQVYGIVTQSGGGVKVESTVNVGTSIIVSLPRSLEPLTRQAEASPEQRADKPLRGKRVLIVEDDDAVADVVQQLAEEVGLAPVRAANASAALAVLAADQKFDLVFSDIIMPGEMDGFELAQEIERRYAGLPIVLTTGFSGTAEIGARYPLLRKPYDPEDFERLLTNVLAPPALKSA